VAGDRAFVGSANFTRKGLAGRDELAVTLDEPELVDELRGWFGELWSISSPAELDDLDEFINTPPPTSGGTNRQPAVSISSDATEITSALLEDTDQKSKTVETANSARERNRDERNILSTDAHDRLIKRLERAPNREWVERHFELMQEILKMTGLTENDSQPVTSVPPSSSEVRAIVGNRVVFGFVNTAGNWTRFILPDGMQRLPKLLEESAHSFHFTGEEFSPHLPAFVDGLQRIEDQVFRRAWLRATLAEVDRRERSPYRSRSHEPIVYYTATDPTLRSEILDAAFPE